jgi:thiol-disulfide isomerase/thioredoxin
MSGKLVLYTRRACHLCDEMLAALEPLLKQYRAKVNVIDIDIDIDGDSRLVRTYGTRIPVLMSAGQVLCEARLKYDLVEEFLRNRQ